MHAKKAIKIISILSDEQVKRFSLFLHSPYLNNRTILIDLFNYILNSPDLKDEKIFSLAQMKKRKLNSKLLENKYLIKMANFLYKELESFLIIESIKNDPITMDLKLLRFYNDNHLDDLYTETLKNTATKLEAKVNTSSIHFFIHENKSNFLSKQDTRKGDINYLDTFNSLQLFYYYNMLKISCLMLNRRLIVTFNYDQSFIHNDINKNLIDSFKTPSISLFYKLYIFLKDTFTITTYNTILLFLKDNLKFINDEDLGIAYTILSNATKHIFLEKHIYYNELFDLYKLQIDNNTIYSNDKIRVSILKNIIALAIHKKDFEWAITFLKNHEDRIIPTDIATESYFYLLSEIYFAKKDFNKSLEYLSKTKGIDNLIKIAIKRLYLKIFFEQNVQNAFDSFSKTYKVFLSRDESLTAEKLESEKKFVNNFISLNKYKLEKNWSKISILMKKIENENIAEKNYLTNTIQQLLAKKK